MEKIILNIKFKGIDDWSRPVYLHIAESKIDGSKHKFYFGSTNILFPDKSIAPDNTVEQINVYFKENINQLEYFGRSFNCEPNGGMSPYYQLNIID